MEEKTIYTIACIITSIIAVTLFAFGYDEKQQGSRIDTNGKEIDGNKRGNIMIGIGVVMVIIAAFCGYKLQGMSQLNTSVAQSTFYYF